MNCRTVVCQRVKASFVLFSLAVSLAACGGGGDDGSPSSGGGPAGNYLLGYVGGFLYDDGGVDIELTSISDFSTISSLATAVSTARNAATFVAQQYSRWQDTFGSGTFPSNSNWSYAAINLEYARGAGLTGAGQTIAIYDSGFRFSHDELAADGRTVTNVNNAAMDDHGTAVASIAAGTDNGGLIEGVAPNANLRLFAWSALGGGTTSWEDSIQDAAANGVIAHNNSWGPSDISGDIFGISAYDLSLFSAIFPEAGFQSDLIDFTSNSVVVFAADNDETRSDSAYMPALPVLLPELEQGWLKVINLFVPYNSVTDSFSTPVRLSAACFEAARWCLGADGSTVFADSSGNSSYSIGTGSSLAAPQVSGGLALLAEAFPSLSSAELRNRLLASADNTFFAHTDELVFDGGYAHGYNAEFGHGLMDLRAALLPIGSMSTLTAAGAPLVAGQASITGGGASGDTLLQGLSEIKVLSSDQLKGDFNVTASSFAAQSTEKNQLISDAASTQYANLETERGMALLLAGESRNSFELDDEEVFTAYSQSNLLDEFEGAKFNLFTNQNTQFTLLVSDEEEKAIGFDAAYLKQLGASTLKVGFSTVHDADSVLGIVSSDASGQFNSVASGVDLSLTVPLGQQSAISLAGQFGVATASGAGLISDFDRLNYASFGLSYGRANLFETGDTVTFYAERPVKIVNGSAYVTAASSRTALSALEYTTHEVDLSPSTSQVDIGFDYRRKVFDRAELHLGMRHSTNYGHIGGERSTAGLMRLQWSF